MTRSRSRNPMSHIAIVCAVCAGLLIVFAGVCRAAVGVPDPVVTAAPIDWAFWIAMAAAAAAFVSLVLHAVARKTHSATVEKIADELDTLRQMVGAVIPAVGVPTSASSANSGDRPAPGPTLIKSTGTAGLLAVLLLGALAAPALTGCGGSQASRSATISSVDSGLRAAIAALRTYEHTRAEAAIAGAKTLDDGKAALAALRSKTEPAWRAVDDALVALDTATAINDDPSVKTASAALATAVALVTSLTGGNAP